MEFFSRLQDVQHQEMIKELNEEKEARIVDVENESSLQCESDR